MVRDLVARQVPPGHQQLTISIKSVENLQVPPRDVTERPSAPDDDSLVLKGSRPVRQLLEQLPHGHDVCPQLHRRRCRRTQLSQMQVHQAPGSCSLIQAGQASTLAQVDRTI